MSNDRFERGNVDRYLFEVAKEYKKTNRNAPEAEIIVVGGAAMLLNYNFRDTTSDIDVLVRASSSFKDAVNKIGDKYGLANGWLNSEFTKTESYSPKLVEHSKYYKTFCGCLTVRTVSSEYLIAMKIKSGRFYKKDMSDIIGIIKEHEEMKKQLSFDDVDKAVRELYGGWDGIKQGIQDYVKEVFENDDLENLYYEMMDFEEDNFNALKKAVERYPDTVNEENIDSFIEVFKPVHHDDTGHQTLSIRPDSILERLNKAKIQSAEYNSQKETREKGTIQHNNNKV